MDQIGSYVWKKHIKFLKIHFTAAGCMPLKIPQKVSGSLLKMGDLVPGAINKSSNLF